LEEKCAYIRGRAEQKRPKQKSSREHERKRVQSFFFFFFSFKPRRNWKWGELTVFFHRGLFYIAQCIFCFFFPFSERERERGERETKKSGVVHEPLSIRWNVYDGTWEERMSWSVK
jgi:hypothetical protein